ncbi:metal ABC transporter solute-binding protein, Zn/Mn family [Lacibacterium aquatile]|uniref:Metal ABC transporter solute-binding protein, Zn/Mn family n=1 Tax=Lacibacterium aquatile TaxID=1168082 RepID=A0ABW5DQI9_9PROT
MSRLRLSLLSALSLLIAAPAFAEPVKVIASFSILGDMVSKVAGPDAEVRVLVGPDGDGHVYQPTPADAKAVAEAKAIFVNGLGFEGWMPRLIKSSGAKGPLIQATKGIKPLKGQEEGHGHGHDHGNEDPHAWHDLKNAQIYVKNIVAGLSAAAPEHAAAFAQRGAAYSADLAALDQDIRASIDALPKAKRKVITSHDAFAYFGRAYGITFLSPQGVSTEAEASAKDVANLIRQMRKEKIRAVFVENITDARLVSQIAKEANGELGSALFSDALSPDGGPAPDFISLMRYNTAKLTEGMAKN